MPSLPHSHSIPGCCSRKQCPSDTATGVNHRLTVSVNCDMLDLTDQDCVGTIFACIVEKTFKACHSFVQHRLIAGPLCPVTVDKAVTTIQTALARKDRNKVTLPGIEQINAKGLVSYNIAMCRS